MLSFLPEALVSSVCLLKPNVCQLAQLLHGLCLLHTPPASSQNSCAAARPVLFISCAAALGYNLTVECTSGILDYTTDSYQRLYTFY